MKKTPTLSKSDMNIITQATLDHYNQNAQRFWQGTKDHDVTQNYKALLSQFNKTQVLDILDFGCGPGRDVAYFKSLGHNVVGLDGSLEFCEMARELTGCEILNQSFLELELPANKFDAVFANASLFHVPKQSLAEVLIKLHKCLKPEGILFTSNPRGTGESISNGRYANYMEFELASKFLQEAGFKVLIHYYRPEGLPIDQQPWLAMVSQKK